ncbi:LysR family transcriptional regulator [Celeribacter halophilus]|uniref:LysR family transcriptional regulator n=1 Tax=Celeribacter halophilus TaxID=576117 RepID=UPI001C09523C|nr:LysR family transcriptional regulator [Celeribacter halophilus]MBU2888129.1 LysR family transcriptional regulator [Celeribacter halophilus]MDO6511875.1 LysR family transcriptional regulator [Celeribacter halophilus]
MNIDAVRTFLELSRLGNFSRVAEQMNVTQSTVSARIKVLEDSLDCRLFDRGPTGVTLTAAGLQFHRYAASMLQLWQQGRSEIRQSSVYDGSIGIGVHITIWRTFMPSWMIWMRQNHPGFKLRVEADYSERLTEYVRQGVLDLAVTHMPRALPGLKIDELMVDSLVLVSSVPCDLSECNNQNYVHIDWSYGYREDHLDKLPQLQMSQFNVGHGDIALQYLLQGEGCAYLPYRSVANYLDDGSLHRVSNAPELARPCYLVRQVEAVNHERIEIAVEGLKRIMPNA